MTLQEAETRLSKLNSEINRLLEERESVLKEWNIAFNTENSENIACVDENIGGCHDLYLVNGDSKLHICLFDSYDMEGSIEEFYKRIDTLMGILNIAYKKDYEIPEYQKNLVYAKAIEIRENMQSRKVV